MHLTSVQEIIQGLTTNLGWFYAILAMGLSAALSAYAIPIIIHIAHEKELVDKPGDERKQHERITPLLGGLAIFTSLVSVYSIVGPATRLKAFPMLVGATMILYTVGLKDDLLVTAPGKKLISQVLAGILVYLGGIHITNMFGIFGLGHLSFIPSMLLTVITVVAIVNAYNLIDGVDGLAGSVGLIASLAFGSWYWSHGFTAIALLAFTLAGALLGFLWFNFYPARIFMGDAGSLVVGFLLAVMAIRFIEINANGLVESQVSDIAPLFAMTVLIVPIYDTLRVFLLRAIKKRSPFHPGRDHVHHQLLGMGFSQRGTVFVLSGINLGAIGLIWLLADWNINLLLAGMVISTMIVFPTNSLKRSILWALGYTVVRIPSEDKVGLISLDKLTRYSDGNSDSNGHNGNGNSPSEEQELEEVSG